MFSCCTCAAADVDNLTASTELREYHEPSSHPHPSAPSATGVSDVSMAVCGAEGSDSATVDDTRDTVASVSTQSEFDESHAVSKTQFPQLDVDDQSSSRQHGAAINLLLWKLIELERRVTLGQVTSHTRAVLTQLD